MAADAVLSPAPVGSSAGTAPEPTSATAAAVRYQARFDPQAWIQDYAVSVDPEGPTTWDCTAAVRADQAYFDRLVTEGFHGDLRGGLLDNDDVLMGDLTAPEWVREWHGPFSIWVTIVE